MVQPLLDLKSLYMMDFSLSFLKYAFGNKADVFVSLIVKLRFNC